MIRKATAADAASIAAIYNIYVEHSTSTFEIEPVSAEDMAARIASFSAYYPYYVWEETADGDTPHILGYCYAHRWHDRAAYAITAETSVYIHPDATGRNIGRELMHRVIDDCRAMGLHSLIACITAENVGSIAFHQSLGFVPVAHYRQVGQKFGRKLDVVDLQLTLK